MFLDGTAKAKKHSPENAAAGAGGIKNHDFTVTGDHR
jgi:hypothetical protein